MNREEQRFIWEVTEEILKSYNYDTPLAVESNIYDLVSRFGGIVKEEKIAIWTDSKLSMASDNTDFSFVIYVSPEQRTERKKFTIAHELGHLFLHTNYTETRLNNTQLIFPDFHREGDTEKEYEANEFAASLLMPRVKFLQILNQYTNSDRSVNIRYVADYFGVSVDAAINRGKCLGVLAW